MSPVYSVVIPAFDEEKTIARAIQETVRYFSTLDALFEVIVVDDGSRDRTAETVGKLVASVTMLRLVRLERNSGKGAAVRRGALEAKGKYVLFLDADLATKPSEFRKFLPFLRTHDIIIGSRRASGARIKKSQPFYRVLAGRAFNLVIRIYLGLPFSDTQCGFKSFDRRALELFRGLRSTGWAFDVELLRKALRRGFTVKEVPVEWSHGRESRVRLSAFPAILGELRKIKHGLD